MHTATCPNPSRGSSGLWDPPLWKPLSPEPVPPPTLLAGVGVALVPPATEAVGWFWVCVSGIFSGLLNQERVLKLDSSV